MEIIRDLAVDFSGNDFLLPYFQRQWGIKPTEEPQAPAAAIKIVTDETQGAIDAEFEALCRDSAIPEATLYCPYIVGTGMTGLLRKMAAGIYRGGYVNIKGNATRISVVHAVDVARAASIAAGVQGAYTLTDGTDPTIEALADAIAYRLGDKRIFTIAPRWARLWLGSTYFTTLTTDHVEEDTFCKVFPDFKPEEVVHYLKTHVYDQQSL